MAGASICSISRVAERVARSEKLPPQWAGLQVLQRVRPERVPQGRDDEPASRKSFDDAKAGKPVRLFKSHRDGIGTASSSRDFIYVDDAVAVVRWLLETPQCHRHFQCRDRQGAQLPGHDQRDVCGARAQRRTSNMSTCRPTIRDQYQYFTQAEVANLQRAGYNAGFTPLEDCVRRYVTHFLDREDRYR